MLFLCISFLFYILNEYEKEKSIGIVLLSALSPYAMKSDERQHRPFGPDYGFLVHGRLRSLPCH